MATNDKKVKRPSELEAIVGSEAFSKMGNYKEATGGGQPIPKGETLAEHPEIKCVQQPRDEDGRFTYNSVNFKELKTKKSRGYTVPPFLRGVKINFAKKGDKNYMWSNGKRYEVALGDLDEESFARMFTKFKGELEDGTLVFGEGDKDYKLSSKVEAKRGAYSKEEKASKEYMEKTGQTSGVHTKADPFQTLGEDFTTSFGYYISGVKPEKPVKPAKPVAPKPQPQPEQPEYPKQPQPPKPEEKKDINSLLGLGGDDEDIDIDVNNVKDIFSQFKNK